MSSGARRKASSSVPKSALFVADTDESSAGESDVAGDEDVVISPPPPVKKIKPANSSTTVPRTPQTVKPKKPTDKTGGLQYQLLDQGLRASVKKTPSAAAATATAAMKTLSAAAATATTASMQPAFRVSATKNRELRFILSG